jgi:outer membrane immunogenic protein
MLKGFFLSATVGLILNAPALAADMPLKAAPPVAAAYNWTGFYVGIHGGYAWGDGTTENITGSANFPAGLIRDRHPSGPFAGGQIGANYQFGQWVLGVEADLAASGIEGHEVEESPVTAGVLSHTNGRYPWIGTVTGRLGFAMNNILFYGKGGGVWAGHESSSFTTNASGTVTTRASGSETISGWTAGGGIEIGLHPNISIKAEYDHYDFGTSTVQRTVFFSTGTTPVGTVNLRKVQDTMDLFKIGLNYHFIAR